MDLTRWLQDDFPLALLALFWLVSLGFVGHGVRLVPVCSLYSRGFPFQFRFLFFGL